MMAAREVDPSKAIIRPGDGFFISWQVETGSADKPM